MSKEASQAPKDTFSSYNKEKKSYSPFLGALLTRLKPH